MALYNNPRLVARAKVLAERGWSYPIIAETLGIDKKTVRKIFDPDFVISERLRLKLIDEARASRWQNDSNYQDYQRAYGKTLFRRAQVREGMRALRDRRQVEAAGG